MNRMMGAMLGGRALRGIGFEREPGWLGVRVSLVVGEEFVFFVFWRL